MGVDLRRRPFLEQALRFSISGIRYDDICRVIMRSNVDYGHIMLRRAGSFQNGVISKRKVIRHCLDDLLLAF